MRGFARPDIRQKTTYHSICLWRRARVTTLGLQYAAPCGGQNRTDATMRQRLTTKPVAINQFLANGYFQPGILKGRGGLYEICWLRREKWKASGKSRTETERPSEIKSPGNRKGRQIALPPPLNSFQVLVGRNCSSHNEQQQQRNQNAARGRRGCRFDNFRFHGGFSNAASESGGSSNRQSGSESDFFHVYLQFSAYRQIRRGDGTHPRIFLVHVL